MTGILLIVVVLVGVAVEGHRIGGWLARRRDNREVAAEARRGGFADGRMHPTGQFAAVRYPSDHSDPAKAGRWYALCGCGDLTSVRLMTWEGSCPNCAAALDPGRGELSL